MLSGIRRTPPPASPHSASEPNLTSSTNTNSDNNINITHRKKIRSTDDMTRMEKMIEDMKEMFSELVTKQNEQNEKMNLLQLALEDIRSQNTSISVQNSEIRTQNEKIKETIDFLSEKYDDALVEINDLRAECSSNKKVIKALEIRVDFLEKQQKAASLEIKNLPSSTLETRESLTSAVQKLGQIISQPVSATEIKNIFRYKSKSDVVGPVLVEFTSVTIKEQFLKSTKDFNKHNKENRLNTSHLVENGPRQPLYVNEVLTAMTRRLHYLARELTKEFGYHQCWVANGKVYIREKDGMSSRLIKTDEDLAKLRKEK